VGAGEGGDGSVLVGKYVEWIAVRGRCEVSRVIQFGSVQWFE